MFVAKRILIITNNMKFALNAKKALERDGKYEVSVFSSANAGVDYAREHPQDVAVLDFRMKDMPGTDMVDHLRAMQHDLAVIAAPNHPAIHDLKDRYNIQQVINIPISLRKFVAMLNTAAREMYEAQTDTSRGKPLDNVTLAPTVKTLEFWLADTESGETILEVDPLHEPELSPESSATFQRLAAEEPPMPEFIDGSTIHDLRARLTNLDEIKQALASAAEELETEGVEELETEDTSSTPASMILETALDESTSIRTFSLQEFMQQVVERGVEDVSPLPSWRREDEKYVKEPEFLPEDLPFPELDEAIEYTGTVTVASVRQEIPDDPGEMITDPIEPVQRSHPPEQQRQEIEAVEEDHTPSVPVPAVEEHAPPAEPDAVEEAPPAKVPSPPELPDLAVAATAEMDLPFTDFGDDPELAQLATTLTQVALELTAEATVLARDGEIVGYAGKLPMSDLEGLLEQLTVEWDKAAGSDKSRILFATIPRTGAEFMVSTRATDFGFTLSLVFAGTRPLHDIRRQSKRLLDALANLPEPEEEPAPPQPSRPAVKIPLTEEVGVRAPIAYLWLQRDPDAQFDNASQKRIVKSLDVELTTSGWKVGEIKAPDYVYIYGEMPLALNPRETLDELMQITAQVLDTDPATIWDDSYLILQPGREMTADEIQRFIDFARR